MTVLSQPSTSVLAPPHLQASKRDIAVALLVARHSLLLGLARITTWEHGIDVLRGTSEVPSWALLVGEESDRRRACCAALLYRFGSIRRTCIGGALVSDTARGCRNTI